ncbi:hypothetical protein C8J56DRAFT_1060668 [Mycena floridula]|nr:hypothetical protein C8J56DRAFT_1060668 [Mycena floridula]
MLLDLIAKDAPLGSLRAQCNDLLDPFRSGLHLWIPDDPEGPTVAEGRAYPLLMALSVVWSTSLLDPSNILDEKAFINEVRDYLYSVRFFAIGTPVAQRVYASATHAIACITSEHPDIAVQHFPLLDEIRGALCSLDDPTAIQSAVSTFKLPVWWGLFDNLQVLGQSRFMEDSCITAIHCVFNLLRRSPMPQRPDKPVKSLVSIPPPVQRTIAKEFSFELQFFEIGWSRFWMQHEIDNTIHLFQLLSTLDDPEAVMTVQQTLESHIRPNHKFGPSAADVLLQQAILTYEALRSRSQIPEFALQAIAVQASSESSFTLT